MNAPQNDRFDSALERELRRSPTATPPADLAAKIRAEIPGSVELRSTATASRDDESRSTPWLRIAATLAFAAIAGTVAWRTIESRRSVEPMGALSREDSKKLDDPARVSQRELEVDAPPARGGAPQPLADKLSNKGRLTERSSQLSDDRLAGKEELGRVVRFDASAAPPARDRTVDELATTPASAPPSPAILSPREQETAAPAKPAEVIQQVIVSELTQVPKVEGRTAPAEGLRGAAPAQQTSKPDSRMAPEEFARRNEFRESIDVRGKAGAVDVRGSASAVSISPDTMIFRDAGTHRFVLAADDPLSTFALDVDTGSYTLTRSYLERGVLPPPAAIRVEEFVNAMTYRDPAPMARDRDEFALYAEGAASPYPDAAGLQLLRFAVRAREVDARDRKPANLTFVVDVSGSMNQENRLGLVKRALGLLLDELKPDDRVALAVYGSEGRILLHPTRDHEEIRQAIDRLRPEGSTNAEAGLRLGYQLADEAWEKGEINRIILCSDGVANVGATGPESILARIGDEARRGIQLTTIGFGMGNYNDALMERLADQGDGSYHYVDGLDEASKVFVENLTGMLQTIAKDAKIQVEFDPTTVLRWRLVGYENRDVADRDFRNDAVDAGEVGAGQGSTALYEVRLQENVRASDRIATLHLRWKSVDGKNVRELRRELRAGDVERNLHRGNRDLRVAATAAMFAERLKATRAGVELPWHELENRTRALADEFPRDNDVQGLADLVRRASRLAGSESPVETDDEDRRGNDRLDGRE